MSAVEHLMLGENDFSLGLCVAKLILKFLGQVRFLAAPVTSSWPDAQKQRQRHEMLLNIWSSILAYPLAGIALGPQVRTFPALTHIT